MPKTLYSAILFDFDGTLVDSVQGIFHCMVETLLDLGRPEPAEADVRRVIGLPLVQCFRLLAPEFSDEEITIARARYRDCYLSRGTRMAAPFPGARETLLRLNEAGARLAVVSNKAQGPLEASLEHMGLSKAVELAVGVLPGRPSKPDPALWDAALSALGRPQDALMVGDAEPDLAFAQALGASAAYAAYGYGDPETCLAYAPRHVLRSIVELEAVVL